MTEIRITTPFIKLDGLLKFAGISFDGAEAKEIIRDGLVLLNGEVELRRGKKIYPGDTVRVNLEKIYDLKVVQ